MERPYSEDDARTAALDDRPTPRRNRRFRGRDERIPEYEPPRWRDREERTAALPRDAKAGADADLDDATAALPGDDRDWREPPDDSTRPLPREDHWREDFGPPRQVVLDRYRLERRIGAGGFGVVWLAFDEKLEREVAVKVVPKEGGEDTSRAEREARVAARLNHPGIVALYELGADDDAVYLVSELVPGRTLAELIRAGAVSDRDISRIGAALCDALAHAHQKKVIHRDVKPQNVLVVDEPAAGSGFAKLADFGIAHLQSGDPLTRTGDVVGTLAYMAPEQAEGARVTAAADVYSLALTLYEGWTGQNPVRANSPMGTARRLGTVLPPLRSRRRDLPEELGHTIDQALHPDPEQRPPIRQLKAALNEADRELSNEGGLVEPGALERLGLRGGPDGTASMPLPSERALALAGRFAAGAAAGGLAVAALQYPDGAPPAPPLVVGTAVAIATMFLPRIAFLATAVAAGVWLILPENGLHGAALTLLILVAATVALLPRAGLLWSVPALAPLLGAIGLGPLFPVLAGQATTAFRRAGLAAAGFLTLAIAEIFSGSTFLFGSPDGATSHHEWERSLDAAANHALEPLVTTAALLPAVAWIGLAIVLPWVVRGRSLTLDLLGAIVWVAGLIAAHQAIGRVLDHHDPRGIAAAAVAAAVVAVAVPRMAGPR